MTKILLIRLTEITDKIFFPPRILRLISSDPSLRSIIYLTAHLALLTAPRHASLGETGGSLDEIQRKAYEVRKTHIISSRLSALGLMSVAIHAEVFL
jgi:hypothetical protein